ncbi:hypothetical protein CDAR_11611 [Caerostris darwini]|uniref:Uncharacterized protein n=1 Tax=Caerostris darwini TaxID=1538125 RepID=A0AAV4RDG6_9ARAC|nr:hypothetical protein CDAR_11611 [Caerostris darwini]
MDRNNCSASGRERCGHFMDLAAVGSPFPLEKELVMFGKGEGKGGGVDGTEKYLRQQHAFCHFISTKQMTAPTFLTDPISSFAAAAAEKSSDPPTRVEGSTAACREKGAEALLI